MTGFQTRRKEGSTPKCPHFGARQEKQVERKKKKKKRERDTKSCIRVEVGKKKGKKNTFISTSVITGNLICLFLCVGSWGHIAQENKGKKNSKTTGLQKIQERERDITTQSKKKKNVTQKVKICYGWISKKKKNKLGGCKMQRNVKDVKKNKFKMSFSKNSSYPVKMQFGG